MPRLLAIATALLLSASAAVLIWTFLHIWTAPPVETYPGSPDVRFPDPFVVRNERLAQLRSPQLQGRPLEASAQAQGRLAIRGVVAPQFRPCELVLLARGSTSRSSNQPILRNARPAEDGSYAFVDLPRGDYELRLIPREAQLRPTSPTQSIRLRESIEFDFGARDGLGSVQLRVLDTEDQPVIGTLVAVRPVADEQSVLETRLLAWGRTDARGELRLDQLPVMPLQYSVWVTPRNGAADTTELRGEITASTSPELEIVRIER
jgi:hypothetical protein